MEPLDLGELHGTGGQSGQSIASISLLPKEAVITTFTTKSFTIADPRTFDGDPFEVAERATRQAEAIAKLLIVAIDGARLMARNAQMERDLMATGECDAPAFDSSAEGVRYDQVRESAEHAAKNLRVLAVAAGFNPKRPLTAGSAS